MKTRTGQLSIGFRRGGSAWQRDIDGLIAWAVQHQVEAIDLGSDAPRSGQAVLRAGLRIGTVDLPQNKGMISPDRGRRTEAVAQNAEHIRNCAALGAMSHFVVMLPEKPELPRAENFGYLLQSVADLAPILEGCHARLAIEGWPGPGALCCTPEADRALFREVPSPALGLNFDPSHLIRMGIDHLRFLAEFGDRVCHVHGKDTETLTENVYEYGTEQPATLAKPAPFAGMTWRYAIPGHGITRWGEVFRLLVDRGYQGCVCIELEDAHFNGTEEGEKLGILQGIQFLQGC